MMEATSAPVELTKALTSLTLTVSDVYVYSAYSAYTATLTLYSIIIYYADVI